MSKKEKEINEAVSAKEKAPKKPKNFKKLKFGSMSVVVIVLVLAIVVIANIMMGLLMKRYPVKLDLTPDSRYEISDQSIEILKNMDKDVDIIVASDKSYFTQLSSYFKSMYYSNYGILVDCPFDIIPEMLDKYSVYASQGKGSINVSYVDINKNPEVVSDLGKVYNGSIDKGCIVFRCGDRVKVISPDEVTTMVSPSQNSTSASNVTMVFSGEKLITTNIKSVTDMKPIRAAIVATMNDNAIFDQTHAYIVSSTENFLTSNGYDCTEIDAATDSISPEDYDLLVVAAPAVDFSQDIVSKFSDFLYNNGEYQRNMIYIPNFYVTNLPNMSDFLAEWKISIDNAYVVDETKSVQATISSLGTIDYAPVLTVADADSVGELPNSALPIAAPGARPITILNVNNDSITTEVLKSSSSSHLAQLVQNEEVSSESGEFNVVVKSRKEVGAGFGVHESNLLVIGSPFMMDNAVLSSTNTFNNSSAMLNIVNTMTGKEASEIIPDKSIYQSNLALTATSAKVIQIIVIIAIPALIAIAGVSVLIWRKNK